MAVKVTTNKIKNVLFDYTLKNEILAYHIDYLTPETKLPYKCKFSELFSIIEGCNLKPDYASFKNDNFDKYMDEMR